MADIVLGITGKQLPIKHIPGPEGVRGRNSDNTLIKQVLGWAPNTTVRDGLKLTHDWIRTKVDEMIAKGEPLEGLTTSKVMGQNMVSESDMGKDKQ